jgi:hypothetical protein
MELTARSLDLQLIEKGRRAFVSPYEILGAAAEVFLGLADAVHRRQMADAEQELVDLAGACLFALASIRATEESAE